MSVGRLHHDCCSATLSPSHARSLPSRNSKRDDDEEVETCNVVETFAELRQHTHTHTHTHTHHALSYRLHFHHLSCNRQRPPREPQHKSRNNDIQPNLRAPQILTTLNRQLHMHILFTCTIRLPCSKANEPDLPLLCFCFVWCCVMDCVFKRRVCALWRCV